MSSSLPSVTGDNNNIIIINNNSSGSPSSYAPTTEVSTTAASAVIVTSQPGMSGITPKKERVVTVVSDHGSNNTASAAAAAAAAAATGATTATTTTAASATTATLDFIGSSVSVKDLFALPYVVDRPISVAVHNMGGTLLIDADPAGDDRVIRQQQMQDHNLNAKQTRRRQQQKRPLPRSKEVEEEEETKSVTFIANGLEGGSDSNSISNNEHSDTCMMTRSLVALSNLQQSSSGTHSEALTIVNSIIQQSSAAHSNPDTAGGTSGGGGGTAGSGDGDPQQQLLQQLPDTVDYAAQYIPPVPDPREYLSWKFRGINLLVGSDALIYRSPAADTTTTTSSGSSNNINNTNSNSTALMLRVEDAGHMQAMLQQHQAMISTGTFVPDHKFAKLQQRGKPSYAEAAAATSRGKKTTTDTKKTSNTLLQQLQQQQQSDTADTKQQDDKHPHGTFYRSVTASAANDDPTAASGASRKPSQQSAGRSFAAPDLDQVQLQTCIVPVPSEPCSVGSLLSVAGADSIVRRGGGDDDGDPASNSNTSSTPLSPVSTVLDTYLDNIMANVPQLALCLREKGFIQSVKLLNTNEIPSRLMQSSTLDTSIPFETIRGGPGDPADEVFSPQIMEMNAQALLRFLKTNCTKDNATYLLRRDAGMTNIELYDISSISAQRQQKWIWWLAMISYRFSNRLRHLSLHTVSDAALRRSFRVRQRSLLHNTLDLLETLSDMNGNKHESLIAAVSENLADTFLVIGGDDEEAGVPASGLQTTKAASPIVPPPQAVSSHQPYGNISVDALSKAQDHLLFGIKILSTVLDRNLKQEKQSLARRNLQAKRRSEKSVVVSVSHGDSSSSDATDSDGDDNSEQDDATSYDDQIDPVVTQLFGIHHKLVNVSLRLAEIHLKNYWSSSAMQNLRTAAQRIADSLYLSQLIEGSDTQRWLPRVQLQYTWLWEQCGHFARSFAADQHWRDRGHASGDDVLSVLQDVESAFTDREGLDADGPLSLHRFTRPADSLSTKSNGMVKLQSLSGVVDFCRPNHKPNAKESESSQSGIDAARRRLEDQKTMQRDERRVLVAASIAYSRAVNAFDDFLLHQQASFEKTLVDLLRQRLGDACNETGKVMLNELRNLLVSLPGQTNVADEMPALTADALCSSAEFWFLEGLYSFELCGDLRNLALLRCNLCQCYKLRANAIFAKPNPKCTEDPSHAEVCLQEAANHLQAAHEALEVRETDPMTWDMVSGELAATFLVLGVRRRQSLIGSGNSLMILHALRLSPGKERSIVDPMERALVIYEQMGNLRQAAAAHYQLAQFYSKIWTCQRDEAKTREKLAAAFNHYNAAYVFFARAVRGNEATFCLLCLDLASLYSAVSGEECLSKALLCCLDASVTFAPESIDSTSKDLARRQEWFQKMDTLASSVEEQTFKLLKNLVKLEDDAGVQGPVKKFKDLYRAGLTAKMTSGTIPVHGPLGDAGLDSIASHLLAVRHVLQAIKVQHEIDQ